MKGADSARPLDAYEKWCVRSNLRRIEEENLDRAEVVALLRANGYPQVAFAVERAVPVMYRVRAVTRRPPTHKQMAHYSPIRREDGDLDEGVVTDAAGLADTVSDAVALSPDGHVVVGIETTEQNRS